MSHVRKIAGNTLLRVVARLAGNVIGIIVVAMLTRYLGEEGFGNYTTVLAYLFFFGAIADLGLYMITLSEINNEGVDRSRFYSAVYSLRFFSAIGMLLCAILLIWFFPYPVIVKQGVLIVAISIFLGLLDQIQVAIYQAELNIIRVAVGEFIGKVILIIGVSIGIWQGVSLLPLLWALVAGQGVQWLITYTGVRKRLSFSISYDPEYWKDILQKTWPVALSQLFVLIYFKMDTVFLSLLRPQEVAQAEVGLYGAPYKILEVLIALVPIFMGLIAPLLAKAWSQTDKRRFQSMYQSAFDAFAMITWPMMFGGILLAKPIMNLLAPGFAQSGTILQILMLATGIIFFAHLPTYVIVTIGQQKNMLKAYAIAAALAIVLYVTLIPIFSFWAAAWITVFIEIIILIMAWRRIHQVTKQQMSWNLFTKALVSALGMSVVLYLLSDWNLFVLIVLGGIVYLLLMILLKGITREMVTGLLGIHTKVKN